jgi:hypothetical protein
MREVKGSKGGRSTLLLFLLLVLVSALVLTLQLLKHTQILER